MKAGVKVLSIMMAAVMMLSLVGNGGWPYTNSTVMAQEVIKTGVCGDNADWNFNTETGVLNITGSGAMYDNPGFGAMNIKKVNIGEGITSVGNDSFISRSSITEVIFPSTLEKIGSWAFWGCDGLTSISIPASVNYIGNVAFERCTSLKSILVDNNNSVFSSVDGVMYSADMKELIIYPSDRAGESFTVLDSVETVGLYAFDYNKNIKKLIIPAGVKTLGGEKPFTGAMSLTDIDVDKDNLNYCSVDGNLYNKDCTKLIKYAMGKTDETFTIPGSVLSVESRAFQNCTNLKNIVVPDNVVSIGSDAFDLNVKISAYEGSAAYNYAVKNGMTTNILAPKEIVSVEIMQLPKKLKYAVGDNYNSVGMILRINYSDGTYGLRDCGFETEGFNSQAVGECIVTVKYGDFSVKYVVEVVESIDNEQLIPGQTSTVDIVEKGKIYYIDFVPDKTGKYTLTADSGSDTYAIVYDESGNQIVSGDDTELGSDFSISYTFEAGKTYVIGVAYSDVEQIGSFTVNVTYDEPEETTGADIDVETTSDNNKATTSANVNETTTAQKPTWTYEERTTPVKVPRAKIKSAVKKKSSKNVKISLKKLRGIKKYQVQISTSKKFKKILVKKVVKRVTFILKSRKLRNRKTLYVRVRAIKTVKGKYYRGKWARVKKVKVRK